MTNLPQNIYVYLELHDKSIFVGTLYASTQKGRSCYSFEYDDAWLCQSGIHVTLDPDLSEYRGRQYAPADKGLFGLFADSCPDRWGRLLMNRREVILARKENRKPRKLSEADYLLGVYDAARMGALRYSTEKDGAFLANDKELATPPWTTLRQLETASLSFERDKNGLEEKWLKQLLAPGSSLGGARPKATVQDPEGNLWIAKFPSKHDEFDVGKWEMTVHDLAKRCGLNVPEAKSEEFSEAGSTFLVKRFDRNRNKRIHFSSAMSLLGQTDGDSSASYLDLAKFIRENGASPKEDLQELWSRIVFSMAVSNTDDHLRNHGFLLAGKGWQLAPLYDVNPCVYGDSLSLNVSDMDNTMDYDLAISTAKYYGIDTQKAQRMVRDISGEVKSHWQSTAKSYGISRAAMEYMRSAFSLE
ncbi:MAG: type II toxin-antitoxin system HipA family toxin [Lachnospiraceae bacterium]|nr:type II toxin-antitoxin system HipA family toxin [Lachnospiraceae bacterium]